MKRHLLATIAIGIASAATAQIPMLVGTYTDNWSKGIYSFRFDQEAGTATELSTTPWANPSYLALSADGKRLYAVDESDKRTDSAAAFDFDATTGRIIPINSQPTGGKAPCFISTNGEIAVTANYNGGSISVFPIAEDGSLLPHSQKETFALTGKAPDKIRQNAAHVHCVRFSPDGTHLFATDLGNDKIYSFNIKGTTLKLEKEYSLPDGCGPRHITFSSDGKFAYLITELSGEVMVLKIAGNQLTPLQKIDCDPSDARGSADIHISPDGRFLYASNRLKKDGISIFKIDKESGLLKNAGYCKTGIHPRNFNITPNGKYLLCACRDSNAIKVYSIDQETGALTDTCRDIDIPHPVCIIFGK